MVLLKTVATIFFESLLVKAGVKLIILVLPEIFLVAEISSFAYRLIYLNFELSHAISVSCAILGWTLLLTV